MSQISIDKTINKYFKVKTCKPKATPYKKAAESFQIQKDNHKEKMKVKTRAAWTVQKIDLADGMQENNIDDWEDGEQDLNLSLIDNLQ